MGGSGVSSSHPGSAVESPAAQTGENSPIIAVELVQILRADSQDFQLSPISVSSSLSLGGLDDELPLLSAQSDIDFVADFPLASFGRSGVFFGMKGFAQFEQLFVPDA